MSPGYSYQHAPRQDVFLGRRKSKELFREIFRIGKKRGSKWHFNQSSLFVDFLAGNQSYQCTPWANPNLGGLVAGAAVFLIVMGRGRREMQKVEGMKAE